MSEQAKQGVAAALAGLLLLVSTGLSLAYWPGLMTWDSIRQYEQALSGAFDDWHPPLMNWIWGLLAHMVAGPAPMLLLQIALAVLGYGLMAGRALRQRRRALAVAVAAASLLPVAVALMGVVVKDSLMAAMLLAAAGLSAWRGEGRGGLAVRIAAGALVVLACAIRFNAFLAGAPLLMALLPARLRATPLRMAGATAAAMALLFLPMPIANHLLGAERSGVELSLVIFDLGGITEHSGSDAFPPLPVTDAVAANHRCYSPVKWDSYADWAAEPCPLGFDALQPAFKAQHINPELFWMKAILAHPFAYAQHRLAHFNIHSRLLVRGWIDRPVPNRSIDNDWKFQVTPNPALKAVDALALASAATPLGWPIFWIALAAGTLTVAWRLPSRDLVLPLALSALLYGLGYGVVSVSSELRYHLWTMIAALLAAFIAMADAAARREAVRREDWLIAASPVVMVVLLGSIWRLLPAG